MTDPARPYYNDKTGQTVMMTDQRFSELAPGHAFRRLKLGEVVPPAVDPQEDGRMTDDGGPHAEVGGDG